MEWKNLKNILFKLKKIFIETEEEKKIRFKNRDKSAQNH